MSRLYEAKNECPPARLLLPGGSCCRDKVFSTHPLTDDRIAAAQKNIQQMLPEKPEYIVTTSEFNDVKSRLGMLLNKRTIDVKDGSRPRLRRSPGNGGSVDDNGDTKEKPDQDERPTLKRRDP